MSVVAGWYADPAGPGALRWWDGSSWTAATAPLPPPQAPYGAVAEDAAWNPMDLLVPKARTLGVRALVWGIVGMLLPIAFAPAVMALVFGAMGLDRGNRLRAAGMPAHGRGASIAGLVLGGVSLVAVIGLVVFATLARG